MPYYECVFIARQDISAAQVDALVEGYTNLIGENGGKVTKTEYWGLKTLAYRIKKNRKGHYALMNIDAPAAAVQEMERTMRINEDVIRYLSIKVDELDDEPSIQMQRRSSRDDRDDRDRGRRYDGGPRGAKPADAGAKPADDGGKPADDGGKPEREAAPAAGSEAGEEKGSEGDKS